MSQSITAVESSPKRSIGDAFAAGVVAMLVINIAQRLVGLVRNLGFSMFLPEDQLGLWSLANSFFVIAPPFIVLGLPGSFGKFVEHYRQNGDLKGYLRQVAVVCGVALLVAAICLLINHDSASIVLYGQTQPFNIIAWTVITLVVLTFHNFLYDIVLSLRQVRLVSLMQFVNSFAFCILGVTGIYYFQTWAVLLPCFAISYLLAIIPGIYGLGVLRGEFNQCNSSSDSIGIWKRVVPFAIALWATNLLTNAFELSDRFMLLHFSGGDPQIGQAHVGQFYTGRILPNLLLSLAMMFSGIFLPYLSADWERKQFDRIHRSMNNMLTLMSIAFTGLSVGALAASPILFDIFLSGRFGPAQAILPLGMMQATWSGITMIASAYLFCAEKGRQNAILLAIGLALNICLNWPLIDWLGLYGAALATTSANAVLFILICWRLCREGCPISGRTMLLCCLPLSLFAGVYVVAVLFLILAILCVLTNCILHQEDRDAIDSWIIPKLNRLGLKLETVW
ncbi:MAG: oligosaccharide flippase family protein [Pirellulales bacterium]